jgi:hypothetical protein
LSIQSTVALSVVLILAFGPAATARDDGVPNIDLQKLCRSNQIAIDAAIGTGNVDLLKSCVEGEQRTRELLVKEWATFSAADKSLCVQPNQYLPSYVEWYTCAQMQRDVRKSRKEQSAAESSAPNTRRQSSNSRLGSKTKSCPVVQFGADGSIVSAIAC